MKRAIGFFLTIIFLLVSITVMAESKKNGSFSYKIVNNETVVITGFDWITNGNQDIQIPQTIDGYTVTEIGEYAFSSKDVGMYGSIGENVTIILPKTITTIGEKAFFRTNISSIIIPASVQQICDGAFAGCRNIKFFNVESNNPIYTTIDGVLYNKQTKTLVAAPYSSTKVDIPDGIVSIGSYAFWGIDFGKINVKLPKSIKSIGSHAFEGCKFAWAHDYSYSFEFSNVEEIGDYAFANAYFADCYMTNVKYIGYRAFNGANIIKWTAPKIVEIGDYAFAGVDIVGGRSADLEFSGTLEKIGEGSFVGYDSVTPIKTIDLGKTKIQYIPERAFSYIQGSIEKIILPQTVLSIDNRAFYMTRNDYKTSISINIPSSVKSIGDEAFYAEDGGKKVYWRIAIDPDNSKLTTIGDFAFYGIWLNPKEFRLPSGLKEIGDKAFYCHFSQLYLPSSVVKIGEELCIRTETVLEVASDSYAAIYATQNGYATVDADNDTSWLND